MTSPSTHRVTHVMAFSEVPGQPVFSGAENHLFVLMRAQSDAGHSVRLLMIVVFDGPTLRTKTAELRGAGIDVVVVHHRLALRRRVGPVGRLAVVPEVARILRAHPDDIVHTHLPQASQLGRLAAALARSRRVVDSIHNDDPAFLNRSWRLRFRILDRVTDGYIAISDAVKELLVAGIGLASASVTVVRYGIPAPGPEPSRQEARAHIGLPLDTFVVGFVGRLTEQKGLGDLLAAMLEVPDAVGVIIGGGEDERSLREQAHSLGLTNVVFTGSIPDAATLLRAFDVFCLPSRWEGLGLVLLEAMWRDVAIVASDAGAIPEVLAGGECGHIFPSGDVAALVTALRDVRANPELAADRARAAKRRVRSAFSVERMLSETDAVYSRL